MSIYKKREKHELRKSPIYYTWNSMKQRCTNPNNPKFPNYGGRGIKVCDEWHNSFVSFAEYMGERPKGYQLERVDNNGDYEPGNVTWASRITQMNNQTNTVFLTLNGVTKSISEWSRIKGIKHSTIYSRLHRGWDEEKALSN